MDSREDNMRKKNLLIAILCVTILLLVPFTSISGASVGRLNTKVEIVEEANPVIPYHLFEEMVVLINQLLVDGKDVPEVVDMCNEALELIDSILQMELHDTICGVLALLFFGFGVLGVFLLALGLIFGEEVDPLLGSIFIALGTASMIIAMTCFVIATILLCEWVWEIWIENNILKKGTGLNPQINPESISESDISAFTEFLKSYKLNCYPCMYE
jgi:hypothetical protein